MSGWQRDNDRSTPKHMSAISDRELDNGKSKLQKYFSYIRPADGQWTKLTAEIFQLCRTGRWTLVKVNSIDISAISDWEVTNGKIKLMT
jgi:hypothetical protein